MTRSKPKLGGTVFQHTLADWEIAWESNGDYRHWCIQERHSHSKSIVIVMKNPGSLSGDGANLKKDTTLRILRIVGESTGVNWLVLNLFDCATPKPQELHDNWDRRDSEKLIYPYIRKSDYRFIMFAHGDLDAVRRTDYTERVTLVRKSFASLCDIPIPTTKSGNPVHPMNWQRGKFIDQVVDSITHHIKRA
jgi:Protein of unknown function (DUF1643)